MVTLVLILLGFFLLELVYGLWGLPFFSNDLQAPALTISASYTFSENSDSVEFEKNKTLGEIYVVLAEHLSEEQKVLANITSQVLEKDDIWTEPINAGEAVRVKFNKPLTNENDITIFAKGSARLEVRNLKGKTLAIFPEITKEKYYRIFLSELEKSEDVFLLYVLKGSLEFDFITDPPQYLDPNSNILQGWSSGTGTTYAMIDDGYRQPNAPPTDDDFLASRCVDTEVSEFGFPNITKKPEYLTLWVYASTGSNAVFTFYLNQDDTSRCSTSLGTNQGPAWYSCNWTNPSGDYSSMSIELGSCSRSGGGGATQCRVFAAYIEAPYLPTYPQFSEPSVNATLLKVNETAKFNLSVTDIYNDISTVTGTIDGTNYTFTQGTGSEWYHLWTCTNSNPSVNFTYVIANNTEDPSGYNSTSIQGVFFECDASAPEIKNATINANTPVALNTLVKVNASVIDSEGNLDSGLIEVQSPSSTYNISASQSNSEFYRSFTLDEEGKWYFRFYANDTAGNWGASELAKDIANNDFIEVDASAPWWSNNKSHHPIAYHPSNLSQFNITWIDEKSNLDTVLFESNYSGSAQNYSTLQNGNEFYYSILLSAGTYYWRFWANDTVGNLNVTDVWEFQINKASPNLRTLIDGTRSNHSALYYTNVDLRVEMDISATVLLHIDGSQEASGVAPLSRTRSFSTLGPKNITGIYEGNTNYFEEYETHWLTILGQSRIDWISPVSEKGTPGDIVILICNVSDSLLENTLENYPVSFWVGTQYLGTKLSNSSGLASQEWDTSGYFPGIYIPKCNITDNSTLYYQASTANQDSDIYTLVSLGTPSMSTLSPDLLIGKNNPNDNATVLCEVSCNGGNCEALQIELQYQNASGWHRISNNQLLINSTNPKSCGTADYCSATWDIQGLVDDSFQIRCNALSGFPDDSKFSSTSTLSVFVGTLSIEGWTPLSNPLNISKYDTFQIIPQIRCTAPSNTKAGCGPLTMVARTNQTGSSAVDIITSLTDIKLESGNSWQTYSENFPSSDGGYYEIPFSPITVNMTLGGNGEVRLYDVKVNSTYSNVADLDSEDREVRGHTGQVLVEIYPATTSTSKDFEIRYNISCSSYRCFDLLIYPRYNESSENADTLAPTSASPPAYNISQQPYAIINMEAGESRNNQIINAFSADSPGIWKIDLLVTSAYSETLDINSSDSDLTITEIKIASTLVDIDPDTILEGENSTVVGNCECSGGVCNDSHLYLQYYDGTWINAPLDNSGKLKSNSTSYSLGDLSGSSDDFTFKVTGLVGGDYSLRAYCTSEQDSQGSSSLTLHIDDYPSFSNFKLNTSIVYANQPARFSVDIYDEAGVAEANFTIDSVKFFASQGTGKEWYYDWVCTTSNPSVDWTLVEAEDTEGYYNSSSVDLSLECDARAPLIEGARISATSIVNIPVFVKVNASITDLENHLQTVILEITPPVSSPYNQTPSSSGSEYYHNLELNELGYWTFQFYAMDSGQQVNTSLAKDGAGNEFIEVRDLEDPSISQAGVTPTLSKNTIRVNASVTDNLAVDTVSFTINGTNYTQTGNNGNEWFYLWTCAESNYHYFEEVWANDTSGNLNREAPLGLYFFCDVNAPTYQNYGQNASNPGEREQVKVYAFWDNLYADLDTARLQTNNTGIWTNIDSHIFSNKPEWSNFTIDTTGEMGKNICWRIHTNNSLGTVNNSMPATCFYVEDSTPPTFTLDSDDSGGEVGEGTQVKAQALWDDDSELDYALLRLKIGGLWNDEKYFKFTETPQNSEFTIETTGYPNQTICWNIWANDTKNHWNTSMTEHCFLVRDVRPPTFSQISDNSEGEVEAGQIVQTFSLWDDDVELDYAVFRSNEDGSWMQRDIHKFIGKPAWANFTLSTIGRGGQNICWTVWANDTTNNWNMSMGNNCFFVNDTVPPFWSDNSTSQPVADMDVEHRVFWQDVGGLSGYIFSFDNCAGVLTNETQMSLSGTEAWVNVTKHTSEIIDCTIRWQVWVSDSIGNWESTSIFSYQTLENLPPMWSQNATNMTLAGWPVEHRLKWYDDGGLSGYIFAFNNGSTPTWTNTSTNLQTSELSVTAQDEEAHAIYSVYHEQFDFTTGMGTSTYRPIGSTINTSNAFLITYTAAPSSEPPNWMMTGHIYNETHLFFERTGSGTIAYVSWFLVENEYSSDLGQSFKTQRGEITIPSTQTTINDDISEVDISRAFVLGNCRIQSGSGTGDAQDGYATFELYNSTSVRIQRASTATDRSITCRYEVVEFSEKSKVKVQTGETTLSSTNPASVTVSSFNKSSSFMYHTWDATNNGLEQVSVYGQVVDGTTLRFGRYGSTTYTNRIRWYLVEFPQNLVTIENNFNWDPPSAGTNHRDNSISPAINRSRTIIIHSTSSRQTTTDFACNKNLPYFLDILSSGDNWRHSQYYGTPSWQDQHETRAQLSTFPYTEGRHRDIQSNISFAEYYQIITGELLPSITNINITLNVLEYNNSGSLQNGNQNPDIRIDAYTGSEWITIGEMGISGTGNVSLFTQNQEVISAWQNPLHRNIRVVGVYFDYNNSNNRDEITYQGLWVEINSELDFVYDPWIPLSGTEDWINVVKVVNFTVGTQIKWKVYANDSINNWNSTSVFSYSTEADTEPPLWSSNMTNSTVAGQTAKHSVFWQDNVGLSGYIFSFDNCDGSMTNDTWAPLSGSANWVNVSKKLEDTYDCTIRWQVFVNDSWGGLWSSTDLFTYQTTLEADLRINLIDFNTSTPKESEYVLIRVNVSNEGPSDANNARVWINSTDSNGVNVNLRDHILNIPKNSWTWVETIAPFGLGGHTIDSRVFPPENVAEPDWSNNILFNFVNVSTWTTFYGNVSGSMVLAVSNESFFKLWDTETPLGNVFATDYDASIRFKFLQPLNGAGNLELLDKALGSENFSDSICRTYDSDGDGLADRTTTFVIYGQVLTNVPVTYNNPSYDWQTGILWDASDGNLVYNGTQEVVFVSFIQRQKASQFGNIDYEIKFPALLREMIPSRDEVAIWFEII